MLPGCTYFIPWNQLNWTEALPMRIIEIESIEHIGTVRPRASEDMVDTELSSLKFWAVH